MSGGLTCVHLPAVCVRRLITAESPTSSEPWGQEGRGGHCRPRDTDTRSLHARYQALAGHRWGVAQPCGCPVGSMSPTR